MIYSVKAYIYQNLKVPLSVRGMICLTAERQANTILNAILILAPNIPVSK